MSFKKCKVVMLPTNEKVSVNSIVTRPSDNRMAIVNVLTKDDPQTCIHQHIHILSDEEIKKDDWCYDKVLNLVFKTDKYTDFKYINQTDNVLKIIATTEKLETSDEVFHNTYKQYLPQPSQSFIEKYVDEYNKGNIITDVMVEYVDNGEEDWIGDDYNGEPFWNEKIEIKINPKDNTITIRKVKDSWSIEEIMNALHKVELEENRNYSKLWRKIEKYL